MTLASPLSAVAKTETQTTNKPNKPYKPGGYGVSTTTGWRKIDGWEKDITRHDPNLRHWDWSAMREMKKSYVRLRPGQRDDSRPRRYVQPVHVNPVAHIAQPQQFVPSAPSGSHYVRPVSVPLPSRDAYAKLSAPATKGMIAAPQTSIRLSAPATVARLAAPATSAHLAAPQTHVQLAALKPTPPRPTKAVSKDEMSASMGYVPDSFETPETESNPYGLARHQYVHKSVAVVKGKLNIKRGG